MCHTRELAFQISKEYDRFSKFLANIKVGVFFGGMAIAKDEQILKNNCPHVVVGTPGRILALVKSKKLPLKNLKHFVLDECDKMLEQLDMRRDVQVKVLVLDNNIDNTTLIPILRYEHHKPKM